MAIRKELTEAVAQRYRQASKTERTALTVALRKAHSLSACVIVYAHFGFMRLPDQPYRLFLPMQTVDGIF